MTITSEHATTFGTWVDGGATLVDPACVLARELGERVAAFWSAGTGLPLAAVAATVGGDHAVVVVEEAWDAEAPAWPPEAIVGHRMDRPFGRRPGRMAALLDGPVREVSGRRLDAVSVRVPGLGRAVVELTLGRPAGASRVAAVP